MKGTMILGIGLAGAAGAALYMYAKKTGSFGAIQLGTCRGCVSGMPKDKVEAHRWMESQMEYQQEDPIVHATIDATSGMSSATAVEFGQVLRRDYQEPVKREIVVWDGIGRPVY
jgi:hypothetical protein